MNPFIITNASPSKWMAPWIIIFFVVTCASTETAKSFRTVADSFHNSSLTWSYRFLLFDLRRIWPFLITEATQVLVKSLVSSKIELVQLTPGRFSRVCYPVDPQYSCMTCYQSPQVLPHYSIAAFPPMPSCSCLHQTLMLALKAKNGPAPTY